MDIERITKVDDSTIEEQTPNVEEKPNIEESKPKELIEMKNPELVEIAKSYGLKFKLTDKKEKIVEAIKKAQENPIESENKDEVKKVEEKPNVTNVDRDLEAKKRGFKDYKQASDYLQSDAFKLLGKGNQNELLEWFKSL